MSCLKQSRAEAARPRLGPKPSLTIYCFRFDVFILNLQMTLFVLFAQASLWISLVVSHRPTS